MLPTDEDGDAGARGLDAVPHNLAEAKADHATVVTQLLAALLEDLFNPSEFRRDDHRWTLRTGRLGQLFSRPRLELAGENQFLCNLASGRSGHDVLASLRGGPLSQSQRSGPE